MNAFPQQEFVDMLERRWRQAVLEVELAHQAYAQCVRADDRDEAELGRIWLRLWRAERLRDELGKALDGVPESSHTSNAR